MSNKFWISEKALDIQEVVDLVTRREAGAINTFIGTVREFTKGKRTLLLEYQAYVPMAEKKLAQIGEEIKEKWPDTDTAIAHRIGRLDITDIAVVIAVSTPHRADSYDASRYAIERIKEIVPIWKKEYWENGEEWIGDQKEQKAYPKGQPDEEDLT
ncbi:molybdopterin (MPT) converting factor, subunit 2 [Thalassobacillus devorans]|uniref:Molybdopterin (MPT) converting factor, subunit 2 n=1 Tax=Thalassobacillus devorans TaxID=279813 RepID=A0ABQ1NES3_9BACI|nr:molybdenum cofactor biosynthesis protein MoaE [Thalassobacillus devorans]NIK27042.1 molybdopterin synthase catalytic subunit [Thalassobacillus devorans]GGC74450.1 molybdopterin (MPT) converting factor, subunit 2 [Thalassobacillus devorans]